MTQGLPPQPTCRHIVGGFLLFILLCAGLLALPNVVKWVGAVLTFVPGQLGIIDVVGPEEVVPVHMGENPTQVQFRDAGKYAVFTLNYDLLVINDAVVAAQGKPWIRLVGADGREVPIILVVRGMALFDTPFARGRPVARFEIEEAGTYKMFHPQRDDYTYIVPDYTSGREGQIVFWMLLQLVIVGAGAWYVFRRRVPRRMVLGLPRPTAESRARYVGEQQAAAAPAGATPSLEYRPWAEHPVPSGAASDSPRIAPEHDLLRRLHDGLVGPQGAEAEIDSALMAQGSDATNWSASIGLTAPEAAAYSQGARVDELVHFRYEGWPQTCAKCGLGLLHEDMHWWFVRDDAGAPRLRHIECPQGPQRENVAKGDGP